MIYRKKIDRLSGILGIIIFHLLALNFFLFAKIKVTQKTIEETILIDFDNNEIEQLEEKKPVEIDAVDYPIQSIYFKGKAHWEGVYGLTGEFEGWFSDDDARVPIKANMKILIDHVTIELIKWKRKDWTPPKAG